jgi:ABC-type lipoprotein release transport system permease subunit
MKAAFSSMIKKADSLKYLLAISLRNLLRQKRRNIFLGSAMAFGVMILIIANSFAHGVSDIMFNKVVVYMTGHVGVMTNEGGGKRLPIFRDRERLFDIIRRSVDRDQIKNTDEAVGIFCRALGNGRADNVVLVGIDMSKRYSPEEMKEFDASFHIVEGSYNDIKRKDVENPIILPRVKADSLNLKMNDIVRVRFRNVYGQDSSARCRVVGFISNDNIFMQAVMFLELANLKSMMGYRPWECGNVQITLKNPARDAAGVADKIHGALKPGDAFMTAQVGGTAKVRATILPFMADDESRKLMADSFKLSTGSMEKVLSKDGVMVSAKLAAVMGAAVGSKISVTYRPKFEDRDHSFTCEVNGLFIPDADTGDSTIYMHETVFYKNFYANLPDLGAALRDAFIPGRDAPFRAALGKEWVLLKRTATTDEAKKKFIGMTRRNVKAAMVDVATMYETASDILKLESVMNIITIVAVLVLFFIIILGVINTLRMTIRERTREIGTMRAIGMQKGDVKSIFIMETMSLTFISSLCGIALAFAVMWLLSLISFNVEDNPMGILLLDRHIHFMPTAFAITAYMFLIVLIATCTAWFPSKKASELPAAQALRHYE